MRLAVLLFSIFCIPSFAYAALININTANAELLDTLPGIGPSKAQAIIDYRNLNGSFAAIEDIQNVSGIGPSTYANIKDLITVGESGSASDSGSVAATSTEPVPSVQSGGPPPEYLPIPLLRFFGMNHRTVSAGADTEFTTIVYDDRNHKRDDAIVTWSFGDGMRRTGASVLHKYSAPGEYVLILRATTSDGGNAEEEFIITVQDAGVRVSALSEKGISVENRSSRTVDLSLWRLAAGAGEFKIPADTRILAGHTVLFPFSVTGLAFTGETRLLFPDGALVSSYPTHVQPVPAQPVVSNNGYTSLQQVEPITNITQSVQTNEEDIVAPTAEEKLAAVGAARPPAAAGSSFGVSPLILGLLGVVVAAGIVFVRL